jgi:hypothetical protein
MNEPPEALATVTPGINQASFWRTAYRPGVLMIYPLNFCYGLPPNPIPKWSEPANPGSPVHGDPHDETRPIAPLSGLAKQPQAPELLVSKDQQMENLSKWYKDSQVTIEELRAIIASFPTLEPAKPSTGEALANALRADNFLSPYGR